MQAQEVRNTPRTSSTQFEQAFLKNKDAIEQLKPGDGKSVISENGIEFRRSKINGDKVYARETGSNLWQEIDKSGKENAGKVFAFYTRPDYDQGKGPRPTIFNLAERNQFEEVKRVDLGKGVSYYRGIQGESHYFSLDGRQLKPESGTSNQYKIPTADGRGAIANSYLGNLYTGPDLTGASIPGLPTRPPARLAQPDPESSVPPPVVTTPQAAAVPASPSRRQDLGLPSGPAATQENQQAPSVRNTPESVIQELLRANISALPTRIPTQTGRPEPPVVPAPSPPEPVTRRVLPTSLPQPQDVGLQSDPAAPRRTQQVITPEKGVALENWFKRNDAILSRWNSASESEINSVKNDLAKVLGVPSGSIKLGYRSGSFATEFNVFDLNGSPVSTFTINKSLQPERRPQSKPPLPDPKFDAFD